MKLTPWILAVLFACILLCGLGFAQQDGDGSEPADTAATDTAATDTAATDTAATDTAATDTAATDTAATDTAATDTAATDTAAVEKAAAEKAAAEKAAAEKAAAEKAAAEKAAAEKAAAEKAANTDALAPTAMFNFLQAGLLKAELEAKRVVDTNKPTGDRVIPEDRYFLDQFGEERQVGTKGKLTLAGTHRKLIVCNEIARAMFRIVRDHENKNSQALAAEWGEEQQNVLTLLTKEDDLAGGAAMTEEQAEIWRQFLEEWRADALKAAPDRFKDALLQAAYEITKAGLDVQKAQEAQARSAAASPAASGATSVAASTGSGGYYPSDVIHERLMNGIYRRHNRRMNKIDRIQARR